MSGSNEGNEGNEGNAGNIGGGGGGAGFFPDRVDIPFVTEGNIDTKRLAQTRWREESWTGDWQAWLTLVDFAQTVDLPYVKPALPLSSRQIWLETPAETQAAMPGTPDDEQELKRLVRLASDERADALGEILAQHSGFSGYFMAAMSASPRSHPNTCKLLHIASLVGAFVSMHFKGIHRRARPGQRAPALLPPVAMPGHPAYPSGHATQAYLMAHCVKAALPTAPDNIQSELGDVLDRLAGRIARNREIAGLHFRSDTVAGRVLAGRAFAILNGTDMPLSVPTPFPNDVTAPTGRRFPAIVAAASGEWP